MGLILIFLLIELKVLVQVIFYLKQFTLREDKRYMDMPNVILAGDKTTCFIIRCINVNII